MNIISNIDKYSLKKDAPIKSAIKILQKHQPKIVIVLDDKQKLLGTITDGDIRRGLLKGKTIEDKCSEVMNKKPSFALENDKKEIFRILEAQQINCPILINSTNEVTGIFSNADTSARTLKTNKVIIMAGGEGKRLHPLTLDIPKPLLLVKDKPIIHIIISNFIKHGFNDIYLSVRYKSEQLIEYFTKNVDFKNKISFIKEAKPLGTAGSLSLLKNEKIDKPVIVINGDVLTDVNFNHLLDFHLKSKSKITLCTAEYCSRIPFGIIKQDEGKLKKINEKPNNKYLINAGIYVIDPLVIKEMDKNFKIDMTYLISEYLSTNAVSVFPIHEPWLDVGSIDDYEKAQIIK